MANQSTYERSAWGYVFDQACHGESRYTANQRLVLLALAKHMGRKDEKNWVCFVNDRTLQAETGLGRTAIKDARRGIRKASPPMLKLERGAHGKRLTTNGIPHGCYRYTLLRAPRHQERPAPNPLDQCASRMTTARAEHLSELVGRMALPPEVADYVMHFSQSRNMARLFLDRACRTEGETRFVLSELAQTKYRTYNLPNSRPYWGIEYDSFKGRVNLDGTVFDLDLLKEWAATWQEELKRECPPSASAGSQHDPGEGCQPTT